MGTVGLRGVRGHGMDIERGRVDGYPKFLSSGTSEMKPDKLFLEIWQKGQYGE